MTRKQKNLHLGGTAEPLFTPDSSWVRQELPDLRQHKRIALDRETKDNGLANGLGPGWAFGSSGGHVCGTSLAWKEGSEIKSGYFPTRHPESDCFDPEQVKQWEIDHQRAGVRFVFQNVNYDAGWGSVNGTPFPPLIDDTVCMANMIDEQRLSFNMDSLCEWWGLPGKDESLLTEALAAYGWPTTPKERKNHLWRLPARYVGPYAEIDAVRTLQLADLMDPEIDRQNVRQAYQLEMDLVPMVHEMRRRGIRVNLDTAERAQIELRGRREEALKNLSDKIGKTTSIGELRQNSWLDQMFTHFKITVPRDEHERGSFEAKWMLLNPHWLPQLVCKARAADDAAEKFVGTYIMGFAHAGSDGESRIHASINQFRGEDGGTRTYRFSYAAPPVQQMPHRSEDLSTLIRGTFEPEPETVWLDVDARQQEFRLDVNFAEKLNLTKAKEAGDKYRSDPDTDFHAMVAEMTGLEREPAKATNFAKSYGAGKDKFAAMIGKSIEEAARIMDQYDDEMPFIRELSEYCQSKAERTGFIKLLDGARIHFDKWEPKWISREEKARGWGSGGAIKMGDCERDEALGRIADPNHPWYGKTLRRARCRKAMNALIQGSAARQTKIWMRDCWRENLVPMIQMHDALSFSVNDPKVGPRVAELLENAVKLTIPVVGDQEYGVNWGAARVLKDKNKKVIYDASFKSAVAEMRRLKRAA